MTDRAVQTEFSFDPDLDALESLQLENDDFKNELAEAKQSLHEAKLEVQKLQFQLQNNATANQTPPRMLSGLHPSEASGSENTRLKDLRSLLGWLAQEVSLEGGSVWIQQAGVLEFGIGEERVMANLGLTQQWELRGAGELRLSVPSEVVGQFSSLLRSCQQGEYLSETVISELAKDWEIVVGQATKDEPTSLYILNSKQSLVIILATWPKPYFDPVTYFKSMHQHQADRPFQVGDRVEVLYENNWYPGTVKTVSGTRLGVQCDADQEGVLAFATPDMLRPSVVRSSTQSIVDHLSRSFSDPPNPVRHRRARSAAM